MARPTVLIQILGVDDAQWLETVAADIFDNPIRPDLASEFLADSRHQIAVALSATR